MVSLIFTLEAPIIHVVGLAPENSSSCFLMALCYLQHDKLQ